MSTIPEPEALPWEMPFWKPVRGKEAVLTQQRHPASLPKGSDLARRWNKSLPFAGSGGESRSRQPSFEPYISPSGSLMSSRRAPSGSRK